MDELSKEPQIISPGAYPSQPLSSPPPSADSTPLSQTPDSPPPEGSQKKHNWLFIIIFCLGVAILAAIGGYYFHKHRKVLVTSPSNSAVSQTIQANEGQTGQHGISGIVTAVSATALTVKNLNNDTTQNFTLTSQTKVSKNDQTASANDLKIGDIVLVYSDTKDQSKASTVVIDPQQNSQTFNSAAH